MEETFQVIPSLNVQLTRLNSCVGFCFFVIIGFCMDRINLKFSFRFKCFLIILYLDLLIALSTSLASSHSPTSDSDHTYIHSLVLIQRNRLNVTFLFLYSASPLLIITFIALLMVTMSKPFLSNSLIIFCTLTFAPIAIRRFS
jgi:hypothetical protein